MVEPTRGVGIWVEVEADDDDDGGAAFRVRGSFGEAGII
jgi:hypothetical protein